MKKKQDLMSTNEVHRKAETLLLGNNMTVAEPETLTIRSGGSCSNHYATLPPKKKKLPIKLGHVYGSD